jgi:hypothetical protein
LIPVDGGEAEIGWSGDHEILARDFEQMTILLEGPQGEIDPAVHDAFMDVEADAVTLAPAPALWVDGTDHTDTWVRCLESSQYTNPKTYLEQDPGEVQAWAQRLADAANNWTACAREHGMPGLTDVKPKAGDTGYGPHAEIPLTADPALLRSVLDACPSFDEEILRREIEGDPTLQDDLDAGRILPNPLVLVEEPDGLQEDGYDWKASEDGRRWSELGEVLYEDEAAFGERYGSEQQTQQE